MATSSIKKDFYVIDKKAFEKFKQEVDKSPVRKVHSNKNSSLNRGLELLKQFSFH